MKLVLAGVEYSVNESLQKATLADLYELKVTTGIGMKTLRTSLVSMSTLTDPEDFLEDEAILLALNALIWLCRRRAGESVSLSAANDVALEDIKFLTDAADVEDDTPDPT